MGPQQLLYILNKNRDSLNDQLTKYRMAGDLLNIAATQEEINNIDMSISWLSLGMKMMDIDPESLLIEFELKYDILSKIAEERHNAGNFENEEGIKSQLRKIKSCMDVLEVGINSLSSNQ